MLAVSSTKTSRQLSKIENLGARAKIISLWWMYSKIIWFPQDIKIPWFNRNQAGINLKLELIKGKQRWPSPYYLIALYLQSKYSKNQVLCQSSTWTFWGRMSRRRKSASRNPSLFCSRSLLGSIIKQMSKPGTMSICIKIYLQKIIRL